MPTIKPFRAWRYDGRKVHDFSTVTAPPYDVISKEEQESLYRRNPYNVIRLELAKEESGDNATYNKYTRSASTLDEWKSSGVLTHDDVPALYVYVQDYKEEGKAKRRLGFFAAMELDEKAVLKHENTLAGPKRDRLMLIKATRTNLSPIFGLFEDPKGAVNKVLAAAAKKKPIADATHEGVRHRLYLENHPKAVDAVCRVIRPKPMFIADGHHRFEVACQYRDFRRAQNGHGDGAYNYMMTYFADVTHNPFKIFPTHRLVKFAGDPLPQLTKLGKLEKAKSLADVLKRLDKNRIETKDKAYQFGVYTKRAGYRILTLDKSNAPKKSAGPVDALDVSALHEYVIAPVFGVREIAKSSTIDFSRDAKAAVKKVDDGKFDTALFLRPTSLNEMIVASKKGLKMPQKSTYFWPKLITGLVFNGLE
jgi:uncharacterized protein (DUF1015 family)